MNRLNGKRWFWMSLTLMLGLLLFAAGSQPQPLAAQAGSWQARYWNNLTLSGTPVLQRTEPAINYNWGDGSPHPIVDNENFSAEWIQDVQLGEGSYRFTATTDDGMRVWVDGVPVIDSWTDSQAHTVTGDIYLQAGSHQIRVAYYETGGKAVAQLDWEQLTSPQGSWEARYYNNTTLSGAPVAVRNEAAIDMNTVGAPVPQVDPEAFSASWTQEMVLNVGRYQFAATADDGVRLWVDNQLIIDEWHNQAATTYTAVVDITDNLVPVRLEYYEAGGVAVAQLSWTQVAEGPTPPTNPSQGAWQAQYYNNTALSGPPVLTRGEVGINFNWGRSSPAPNIVDNNRFSARWSQTFNLNPGTYTLSIAADDGVRVYVDGNLLIDAWRVQALTPYDASFNHAGGQVPVVIEYFENTGLAQIELVWSGAGTPPTTPPTQGVTATMTGAFYLNVRSGPGLAFDPFDVLRRNQTVSVIGRDAFANWIEVVLPDGSTGWVSASYMTSATPFTALPVTG
ncbi:MAG: SH3 domain-containing protein [Anaerolineaceae bacterium]|nr:SH3 domain-containing protein [Anaerolineaceae bacterium]